MDKTLELTLTTRPERPPSRRGLVDVDRYNSGTPVMFVRYVIPLKIRGRDDFSFVVNFAGARHFPCSFRTRGPDPTPLPLPLPLPEQNPDPNPNPNADLN